jgi:hypothetical protein
MRSKNRVKAGPSCAVMGRISISLLVQDAGSL